MGKAGYLPSPRCDIFILTAQLFCGAATPNGSQDINQWICSIGGMITTGIIWSTRKTTSRGATTWTALRMKPGLRSEEPATSDLIYGTATE